MNSVKTLIENGFETKADQKRAFDVLAKAYAVIKDTYKSAYLAIDYNARRNDSERTDLYYSFPDLHVWKEKHVALANKLYPELSGFACAATKLAQLRAEVKATPIVKKESKAASAKQKKEEVAKSGNYAIMSEALDEVLQDVIAEYKASGRSFIKVTKQRLLDAGMELRKAYPKQQIDGKVFRLIERVGITEVYKFTDTGEAEVLKMYEDSAKGEFYSFIAKMCVKLGDKNIKSVELTGRIWDGCVVRIDCGDSVVTLNTKCIINRSKFDNLFNQWPTRITYG